MKTTIVQKLFVVLTNKLHNFLKVFISFFLKLFSVIKCIIMVILPEKKSDYVRKLDVSHICQNKRVCFENHEILFDLSIIIPFYNAENYIKGCIESVISQKTGFSYEIILIDDGSSDDSLKIVDMYKDRSYVKLLKQENSGQSAARNKGISYSTGQYLMFVDADDILLPDAIEALMSTAKKTGSDIVEGSFVRFYIDITDEMIHDSAGKDRVESNKKNPRFVLSSYGYSWAKVYRRELWKTLRFPEGFIFEDIISKFILRRNANQVAYIKDVVYGYRMSTVNSSSHGNNIMKKLDSIWVLPEIIELCQQEQAPRDEVFYLLALNHIGILNYITTEPFEEKIKLACFSEMRKQLLSILDCRPKRLPLMFYLLEKAILENKFYSWKFIAETINKYIMLKKWREID